MPSIYTELAALAMLVLATSYGALMSGAPPEVAFDFSTVVALMGLAITIANAAAREIACMTMRWGHSIMLHVILI